MNSALSSTFELPLLLLMVNQRVSRNLPLQEQQQQVVLARYPRVVAAIEGMIYILISLLGVIIADCIYICFSCLRSQGEGNWCSANQAVRPRADQGPGRHPQAWLLGNESLANAFYILH
jgi:hypothetical protein